MVRSRRMIGRVSHSSGSRIWLDPALGAEVPYLAYFVARSQLMGPPAVVEL